MCHKLRVRHPPATHALQVAIGSCSSPDVTTAHHQRSLIYALRIVRQQPPRLSPTTLPPLRSPPAAHDPVHLSSRVSGLFLTRNSSHLCSTNISLSLHLPAIPTWHTIYYLRSLMPALFCPNHNRGRLVTTNRVVVPSQSQAPSRQLPKLSRLSARLRSAQTFDALTLDLSLSACFT